MKIKILVDTACEVREGPKGEQSKVVDVKAGDVVDATDPAALVLIASKKAEPTKK